MVKPVATGLIVTVNDMRREGAVESRCEREADVYDTKLYGVTPL